MIAVHLPLVLAVGSATLVARTIDRRSIYDARFTDSKLMSCSSSERPQQHRIGCHDCAEHKAIIRLLNTRRQFLVAATYALPTLLRSVPGRFDHVPARWHGWSMSTADAWVSISWIPRAVSAQAIERVSALRCAALSVHAGRRCTQSRGPPSGKNLNDKCQSRQRR